MTSSELPPKPDAPPARPRRRTLQFNTATLLGVMALVAVVCALGVAVPGLLSYVIGLAFDAVVIAYAACLLAGLWTSSGNRRIFFLAALGTLVLAVWRSYSLQAVWQTQNFGGPSWWVYFGFFLQTLQSIALSLFGGWVALRAARFWQPEDAPPAPPEAES